jgi:hypothetical protein
MRVIEDALIGGSEAARFWGIEDTRFSDSEAALPFFMG